MNFNGILIHTCYYTRKDLLSERSIMRIAQYLYKRDERERESNRYYCQFTTANRVMTHQMNFTCRLFPEVCICIYCIHIHIVVLHIATSSCSSSSATRFFTPSHVDARWRTSRRIVGKIVKPDIRTTSMNSNGIFSPSGCRALV